MACGCGAPVRDGVCQRGHRLDETWSPASRRAALAARRERLTPHAQERLTPHVHEFVRQAGMASPGVFDDHHAEVERMQEEVRPHVAKLKEGQTHHVPLVEGGIEVTHAARRGPFSVFAIKGGGANSDPDMRRGLRSVMGRGAAAREVAERVQQTRKADLEHTAQHLDAISRLPDGATHKVKAVSGATARITRRGDAYHVRTPRGHAQFASPSEAIVEAKGAMRANGERFLHEANTDPLGVKDLGQHLQRHTERKAADRGAFDELGRFAADQSSGGPADAFKEFATEHAGVVGGLTTGTGPAHLARGSSHLPVIAPQVAHHVAAIAPHLHAIAPHIHALTQVVQARLDAAERDLEEVVACGSGGRIMVARARVDALKAQLEECLEDLAEVGNYDRRREAEAAGVRGALPAGEPAKEAGMTQCHTCGAPVQEGRLVCQRGHRIEEAWSEAARIAAIRARRSKMDPADRRAEILSYHGPEEEYTDATKPPPWLKYKPGPDPKLAKAVRQLHRDEKTQPVAALGTDLFKRAGTTSGPRIKLAMKADGGGSKKSGGSGRSGGGEASGLFGTVGGPVGLYGRVPPGEQIGDHRVVQEGGKWHVHDGSGKRVSTHGTRDEAWRHAKQRVAYPTK